MSGNYYSGGNVKGCYDEDYNGEAQPLSDGYIVTVGEGMTADGSKYFPLAPYYKYASGATVTLSSTATAPTNYTLGYAVNGTPISGNTFTMPDGNVTASVVFVPDAYTITYNLDGGTNDANNPATYTIESAAITLNAPTRTGYDFAGWTGTGLTDATETVTIAQGSTGDCEYTATWTASGNISLTANAAEVAGQTDYWTTFYCGDAGYTIDDETVTATAYTATYSYDSDTDEASLTLHKLGKEIPAGTAVIIVADGAAVSMTKDDGIAAYTSGENHLHGVDVRTQKSELGTGTFYVMGKKGTEFGFFEYTAEYMPARKAYLMLPASAPAPARGFQMVFDDATGIYSAEANSSFFTLHSSLSEWYTLDGRRLAGKPTVKGLYINNGRKVVIK